MELINHALKSAFANVYLPLRFFLLEAAAVAPESFPAFALRFFPLPVLGG